MALQAMLAKAVRTLSYPMVPTAAHCTTHAAHAGLSLLSSLLLFCVMLLLLCQARAPSYYPGDLRVLELVDLEGLRHLRDVLVFPVQGPRPHADECPGGETTLMHMQLAATTALVCHLRAACELSTCCTTVCYTSFVGDVTLSTGTSMPISIAPSSSFSLLDSCPFR
jgi:hypothetical protein